MPIRSEGEERGERRRAGPLPWLFLVALLVLGVLIGYLELSTEPLELGPVILSGPRAGSVDPDPSGTPGVMLSPYDGVWRDPPWGVDIYAHAWSVGRYWVLIR